MNTRIENVRPPETREACTTPPSADPFEPEPATPTDESDFRETPERGYGWGV